MSFKQKRNLVLMILIMSVTFLTASLINTSEAFAFTGEGTEQNPYQINSAQDWDDFVAEVRMGNTGGYYRLTSDITVETTVGTQNHPFTGQFDGNAHTITADISDTGNNGTAPFRYISGATIANVKTDGTVRGKQYVSGLVGFAMKSADGTANTIENNTVAATINGSEGENAGGIVAQQAKDSELIIKDCWFTGEIKGGKNYAGGLLGWSEGGSLVIEDCLFSGSYKGTGKFHPIALKNNTASVNANVSRAYYASTAGPAMQNDTAHVVADGVLAYAKKDADVSTQHFYKQVEINKKTNYFYPVRVEINMAKSFSQCSDTDIVYEVKADGKQLEETVDYTAMMASSITPGYGSSVREVLEIPGTYILYIRGTDNNNYLGEWTIRFYVSNIPGSGSETDPYRISNATQWNEFTEIIKTGKGKTFEGEFVKLTADISVSTMAGTEDHPFSGTFDGQNNKLTSNISTEEQGAAPFHYIKGATIKNITAAGSVKGHEYSAGLVGFALGENRSVLNRINHALITASVTANDYGSGVAGHGKSSTVEITNTVFSGKVTCNMFNRRYTGAGFLVYSDDAMLRMTNCINKGSKGEFYWWNPIGIAVNDAFDAQISSTYYKENVARGDEYGYTPDLGGQLVYTSALSGKISTKVTAADNETYYYDDGVRITGLKTVYGYTGSEINVGYQVKTSSDDELVKNTDFTEKFNKTVKDKGSYTLTVTGKGKYTGSISAKFNVSDQIDGSGTKDDPFIISSANDWNKFRTALSNGYTYKDEYVKLTADISVGNNMAGTDSTPFSGTFNGDGHKLTVNIDTSSEGAAPFAVVNGATIRNLTVAGTVKGGKYTSGLIGKIKGSTVNIGAVTVSATVKSGQYLGGFVGHSYETRGINITSCIFNGTIECTGSSGYGGGFTGWSDYPGYVIRDCLFAGNVTGKFKLFHPAGIFKASTGSYSGTKSGPVYYISSGAQIGSGDSTAIPLLDWNVPVTKVYSAAEANKAGSGKLFTQLLVGGNGTNCFREASSGGISTDKVYVTHERGREEYDTVTPSPVIECNGERVADPEHFNIKYYLGEEEVSADSISKPGDYTVIAKGDDIHYCGSVSTSFKVVALSGEGTEDEPYFLYDTQDWSNFADAVSAGYTFKDKVVALANNEVKCVVPVGDADHPFQGTFDGNPRNYESNYTLDVELDDTETQGTAPFRYVGGGAVIRNLNVQGTVRGGQHAGGLVGFAGGGTVEIYNVNVSATISNGSYIGGIVGHGKSSNLTMRRCAFTGTLTGGSSYAGGLLGWSDGQRLTLEDCIFAGRNKGTGSFHPIAVKNNNKSMNVSAQKVYYLSTQAPDIAESNIGAGGTPVYTNTNFPEDKLLSNINAADKKTYYAITKVGTIAASYQITGKGIAPVPAVSDVNGTKLKNGTDYTATYVSSEGGEPVEKVTEPGEYTLVLKGNRSRTIGEQEIGSFTAEANFIESVSLNKESVSLSFDEDKDTAQLEMTVTPDTAVVKDVKWTSSDAEVATVDGDGLVTAKGIGETTVTVTVTDETDEVKTASCSVEVVRTAAEIIVPPSKNILTYNGKEQSLLNPGTASGGKVVYKLASEDEFKEDIPVAADAGTYTVQYKAKGDEHHSDSQAATIQVTIEKAEGSANIENMVTLRTGNELDLDTLVSDATGDISFEIRNGDETGSSITAGNTFNAGSAGTCTVAVTVGASDNYKELTGEITVNIESKEISDDEIEVTMEGWTYGEEGNDPVFNPVEGSDKTTVLYAGIRRSGESYIGEDIPEDAGDYSVYVTCEDDEYIYFGGADFVISPKDISGAEVTLGESLTYTGSELTQTVSKVMLGETDITEFCITGGNDTVVNAGKYTLIVTAKETSNYTGSVEKEFEVEKAEINESDYTLPTAIEGLVYNGFEQVLIHPGTSQGCVFKYDMGAGFKDKLPAAIDAGTYQINCRVKGDMNHKDIYINNYIHVTIAPITCTVDQAPEAISGLVYTGEAQELVTEGTSSDGDMVYRLGDDEDAEFSAAIPKAKKAGEYKVYYKAAARNENYADSEVQGPVTVEIGRKTAEITTEPQAVENLAYDGKTHELVTPGEESGGTMVYSLSEDGAFSEEIPVAVNAGDYTVYYRIDGGDDFAGPDGSGQVEVNVKQAPFPGSVLKGSVRAKLGEQVDISNYFSSDSELEYSILDDQTDTQDCSLEGSILTTGTGEGKCYVEAGLKGDAGNYETASIYVNISDVTTTEIGVYQDDIVYGKGKVDPKYDDYSSFGSATSLTILYSGILNNGESYGTSEEESVTPPTESGTYTVDVFYTFGRNAYHGQTEFSIRPADIADAKVTLGAELKYTGSELTQEVSSVQMDGKDITDMCTVSDNTATNYGNYKLTVKTGKDAYNYRGEVTVPFTVYPDDATLEAAKKQAIEELEKQYNPNEYTGAARATVTAALAKAKAAISKARTLEEIEQAKAAMANALSGSKRDNTLAAKGKKVSVKYSKLRKKTQKLKVNKMMVFRNQGQGAKSFKLSSVKKGKKSYKKYFKINKKTGQLKIKKKLKKGTYKVKIKVRAAGSEKYNPSSWKTVTVKIKVK